MVFCLSNTSHNRLQPGLCQNGVERGHPEEEGLNLLLSQLVGSVIVFFPNKKHDHVWPYDRSHGHARKTIITLQKDVQRGEDAQILCHDMVCLWLWVKAKLEEHLGAFVQRICVSKLWDSVSGFRIGWQTHHGPDWLPIFIGQRRKKVIGCQNPLAI